MTCLPVSHSAYGDHKNFRSVDRTGYPRPHSASYPLCGKGLASEEIVEFKTSKIWLRKETLVHSEASELIMEHSVHIPWPHKREV